MFDASNKEAPSLFTAKTENCFCFLSIVSQVIGVASVKGSTCSTDSYDLRILRSFSDQGASDETLRSPPYVLLISLSYPSGADSITALNNKMIDIPTASIAAVFAFRFNCWVRFWEANKPA